MAGVTVETPAAEPTHDLTVECSCGDEVVVSCVATLADDGGANLTGLDFPAEHGQHFVARWLCLNPRPS